MLLVREYFWAVTPAENESCRSHMKSCRTGTDDWRLFHALKWRNSICFSGFCGYLYLHVSCIYMHQGVVIYSRRSSVIRTFRESGKKFVISSGEQTLQFGISRLSIIRSTYYRAATVQQVPNFIASGLLCLSQRQNFMCSICNKTKRSFL